MEVREGRNVVTISKTFLNILQTFQKEIFFCFCIFSLGFLLEGRKHCEI